MGEAGAKSDARCGTGGRRARDDRSLPLPLSRIAVLFARRGMPSVSTFLSQPEHSLLHPLRACTRRLFNRAQGRGNTATVAA